MTWTMADRQAFVELLPSLAPGSPAREALAFVSERESVVLREAGAIPGVDQVRAGLLRALRLGESSLFQPAAEAAEAALVAFAEQVRDAPPTLLQRRHPAWVGLASLEAGAPLEEAVRRARLGFETVAGPQGDGDVLWAMAEAAEDVGWSDHHRALLAQAAEADFLDPAPQSQVRLLWALDRLESEPEGAERDLAALTRDVEAPDPVRVHAAWVLSVGARERGERAESQRLLLAALALVDAERDPEVATRLREALAEG